MASRRALLFSLDNPQFPQALPFFPFPSPLFLGDFQPGKKGGFFRSRFSFSFPAFPYTVPIFALAAAAVGMQIKGRSSPITQLPLQFLFRVSWLAQTAKWSGVMRMNEGTARKGWELPVLGEKKRRRRGMSLHRGWVGPSLIALTRQKEDFPFVRFVIAACLLSLDCETPKIT